MKRSLLLVSVLSGFLFSCSTEKPIDKVIDKALAASAAQYELMYNVMKEKPDLLPRTIDTTGNLVTSKSNWWCSGFFPGSLWYLYEYSKDKKFRDAASDITSRIEKEKNNTGTHDLGIHALLQFWERTEAYR